MMKTKFTILTTALLLGAFILSSCEGPVALGKKLNLDPPEVVIERPDFMEDASDYLAIEGTAWDKEEVVYLYLDIERVVKDGKSEPWKHYWRGSQKAWEWRGNEQGAWASYLNGPPLKGEPAWELLGGINDIRWRLPLDVSDLDNGEYIISVNAENNVQNAGTVEQRRVIVDHEPPVVEIKAPVLEYDDWGEDEKYPYSWVSERLGEYQLRDVSVLDMLHNEHIAIQYEIEDDFSIASLIIQLADNAGKYYYNGEGKDVEELGFDLGWSGKIEILAEDIAMDREVIPGEDGSPLFLQVISTASDKAGNAKARSHGWLVWWPESDRPWVEGVGVENEEDAADFTHGARIYPESDVQGQAFDDDGLKGVSYKLYSHRSGYETEVLSGTALNEPPGDSAPSTFFSWGFKAPKEPDIYRAVIDCWDVNDPSVPGNQITRYIYVYPIDSRPLLTSIESSFTGTYSQEDTVSIWLVLREAATITLGEGGPPTLTLDGFEDGSLRTATFARIDGKNGNKMLFEYTVPSNEDDNAAALEFGTVAPGASALDLKGAAIIAGGGDVTDELQRGWDGGGWHLLTYATITIETRQPVFVPTGSGLSSDGETLTLRFSKPVYKRQGSIIIEQTGDYYPPAVMSKADFQRWGGAAALGAYYDAGTNGARSDGSKDTSEKYILKYHIDPADSSAETAALKQILIGHDAHIREIPVVSPRVTIDASDRTVMTVDLGPDSGFALRVKGVDYDVKIPAALVQDRLGNATGDGSEITGQNVGGVNPPFVRLDTETARTRVAQEPNSGSVRTISITKPYTANVRIDTQTPGATINWAYNTAATAPQRGDELAPYFADIWVKNAQIHIPTSVNDVPAGSEWVMVDRFYINLRGNQGHGNLNANQRDLIHTAQPMQSGYNIGISSTWRANDGTWGYDNTNPASAAQPGAVVRISGYLHGNSTDYYMNWDGGNNPVDFWLNPYEHTIYFGNVWVPEDKFRVQWLYVNRNTGTWINNGNPPAGEVGWLAVGGEGGGYLVFDGETHPARPGVAMPSSATGGFDSGTAATFTLGLDSDRENGYLYGIAARASKGGADSDLSYEKVSRSVIAFDNIAEAGSWSSGGGNSLKSRANAANKSLHLWIRGGDILSGDSLTPGFPLQWNDLADGGAGLFSGPEDGLKYWISWEISVPAYYHFIAGTTSDAALIATQNEVDGLYYVDKGPLDWGWAKNSWAFQHHRYPLHPGGSLRFVRGGESSLVVNSATQYFEFYNTGFSGGR